jgi:hypothetical protein
MNMTPPAREIPAIPKAPIVGGLKRLRRHAMAYGHRIGSFIENGPVEQVARIGAARSTARSWRALDEARRLELVERALQPANDCDDEFSLAL